MVVAGFFDLYIFLSFPRCLRSIRKLSAVLVGLTVAIIPIARIEAPAVDRIMTFRIAEGTATAWCQKSNVSIKEVSIIKYFA